MWDVPEEPEFFLKLRRSPVEAPEKENKQWKNIEFEVIGYVTFVAKNSDLSINSSSFFLKVVQDACAKKSWKGKLEFSTGNLADLSLPTVLIETKLKESQFLAFSIWHSKMAELLAQVDYENIGQVGTYIKIEAVTSRFETPAEKQLRLAFNKASDQLHEHEVSCYEKGGGCRSSNDGFIVHWTHCPEGIKLDDAAEKAAERKS